MRSTTLCQKPGGHRHGQGCQVCGGALGACTLPQTFTGSSDIRWLTQASVATTAPSARHASLPSRVLKPTCGSTLANGRMRAACVLHVLPGSNGLQGTCGVVVSLASNPLCDACEKPMSNLFAALARAVFTAVELAPVDFCWCHGWHFAALLTSVMFLAAPYWWVTPVENVH